MTNLTETKIYLYPTDRQYLDAITDRYAISASAAARIAIRFLHHALIDYPLDAIIAETINEQEQAPPSAPQAPPSDAS